MRLSLATAGLVLAIALPLACGGSDDSSATAGDDGGGALTEGGSGSGGPGDGGGSPMDATGGDSGSHPSSCVPSIPQVPWTSPYAAWTRGVPTDPSFFPIAVWLQGPWHAMELSQLGVNVFVGNNAGTDPIAASDLATLKSLGMYAIVGQDSVGLANKDDPTIIGWWMTPDEPDNAQSDGSGGYGPPVDPAKLAMQYAAYEAADPTRPVWLGLGQGVAYDGWEGRGSNPPPESAYPAAADILSFDIYPYNNCGGDTNEKAVCGQFWLNALGVDRLHQWSMRDQAVWTDFETTVIAAGTTTGPTPVQTVSEVWLALIHEANGVVYFLDTWQPSFREDGIFADSAMVTAVTALNKQILALAPELNSATIPNLITVTSANGAVPVDTMVKANGSSIYVLSAAARDGITMASYAVAGLTGDATATVLGESRTIPVKAGKFTDAFPQNGVHIYQIDLSKVTCP